jgi:hypothetical protein
LEEALLAGPPNLDGVRMTLLNWYFLTDREQPGRALALLRGFDRAPTFPWSWALALGFFAEQGDALTSRWWLAQCRFQNRHVPALLTGRRKLPKRMPNPEYSEPGDRAEAEFYALTFMDTWKAIPGALEWLKQFPDSEAIDVLGPGSRTDGWRFFLNTYANSGYIKCPECGQPTAKRKFSIAALVEPNFVPVARLEARACDACNLLIVKSDELTDAINVVIQPHTAGRPQPYFPLGTLEHAVARQLSAGLLPLTAAREHVRLFQKPVSYPPSNYEYQPMFGSEFARALFGDEFADDAFPDIADTDPNVIDIG